MPFTRARALRLLCLIALPATFSLSEVSHPTTSVGALRSQHGTKPWHARKRTASSRPLARRVQARRRRVHMGQRPEDVTIGSHLLAGASRLHHEARTFSNPRWLTPHRVGNIFGVGAFVAQRSGDVYRLVIGRGKLLGAGWVREELTATRLHGGPRSPYYWAPYDRVIDGERSAGLQVLGLLDYSNSWGYGDHGAVPHSEIKRIALDFARFAYAVARHFRGRVSDWQVWNEPNRTMYWHPRTNAADYARLLDAAYRAIKRANPHARVVVAGTSGVDLGFLQEVARHTRSFDILSVHPYRPLPEPQLLEQIQALRSIHKPIWFSEIGWAAGDGCDLCTSEDDQAAYLARFYALAAAAGVQRVFWYDLRDDSDNVASPEAHFGLMRRDLSGKPAFAAYAVLERLLRGAFFVQAVEVGEHGTYALGFRAGQQPVAILWNDGPKTQQLSVPWPATACDAFDMSGNPLGPARTEWGEATWDIQPDGRPVYLVASNSIARLALPGPLLHLASPPALAPKTTETVRKTPVVGWSVARGKPRRGPLSAPKRINPHPGDAQHAAAARPRPVRRLTHRRKVDHGFRVRRLPTSTPAALPLTNTPPALHPTSTPLAWPPTAEPDVTPAATMDANPSESATATPQPGDRPSVPAATPSLTIEAEKNP